MPIPDISAIIMLGCVIALVALLPSHFALLYKCQRLLAEMKQLDSRTKRHIELGETLVNYALAVHEAVNKGAPVPPAPPELLELTEWRGTVH